MTACHYRNCFRTQIYQCGSCSDAAAKLLFCTAGHQKRKTGILPKERSGIGWLEYHSDRVWRHQGLDGRKPVPSSTHYWPCVVLSISLCYGSRLNFSILSFCFFHVLIQNNVYGYGLLCCHGYCICSLIQMAVNCLWFGLIGRSMLHFATCDVTTLQRAMAHLSSEVWPSKYSYTYVDISVLPVSS